MKTILLFVWISMAPIIFGGLIPVVTAFWIGESAIKGDKMYIPILVYVFYSIFWFYIHEKYIVKTKVFKEA